MRLAIGFRSSRIGLPAALSMLLSVFVGHGPVAHAQASTAASKEKKEPTKQQTEEWLREHVEAWNEGDVHVQTKDCRLVVLDKRRERTEVVDLRGLILPVELIRVGNSSDVTIRLRVKQKHTGTYAMYRKCDAQNRYCADGSGKFQSLPFVDLTVTSVDNYFPPTNSTNHTKAVRLERALEHYSRLCGAMEDPRNTLF